MGHDLHGRASGGARVAVLGLILLLALVAAGGWYGWQAGQRLMARVTQLEDALAQRHSGHEQAVDDLASTVADLERRLDDLAARGEQRDRLLGALQQSDQRAWLLNEAEALARLAQERLLLTADLSAAERLLEVADRTLARIDEPDVLPARRALAKDIEAIRGARHVDVPALMVKLAALQELVPDVVVAPSMQDAIRAAPAEPAPETGWQGFLAGLPLRIQRQDGAHPLPLDAQQAALVRLSLDSSLQQARMAVQQGQPDAWRQALAHARGVMLDWLPEAQPRVRRMLAALAELEAAPVDQALPAIGEGRAAIRALRAGASGEGAAERPVVTDDVAGGGRGERL